MLFLSYFSTVIFCTNCYMHEHFLSFFPYALIRSFPDDPGFARPDIRRLMLLIRCSMRSYMLWEAGVFLYPYCYSYLSFYSFFLIFSISYSVTISFSIHMLSLC